MKGKFESEKIQIERVLVSLLLHCLGMELINLLSFSKATRTSPVSLETARCRDNSSEQVGKDPDCKGLRQQPQA